MREHRKAKDIKVAKDNKDCQTWALLESLLSLPSLMSFLGNHP